MAIKNKVGNMVRERKREETENNMSDGSATAMLDEATKAYKQQVHMKQIAERESLVLWRHPLQTIAYFVLELGILLRQLQNRCVIEFSVIIFEIHARLAFV